MRIPTLFFIILFSAGASAEIHTWVDEHGKKHFSDKLPDHLKHKTSTVDYSASLPTESERAEAQRIYKQSKKHADGIPKTRLVNKKNLKTTEEAKKKKHLTRNDKIRLRNEAAAKAKELCVKFNAAQKACINDMPGCINMKRPANCV